MAIAYSRIETRPAANEVVTQITLDASYAAGGYALSNAALGMVSTPTSVSVESYKHATATLMNIGVWDPAANKLMFFKSNTAASPTECASGDIAATHTCRVVARGPVAL